jgi:hypothetical protein
MAIGITYQSLNGSTLPDGDVINAQVTRGVCPSTQIQIALKLNGVNWWKGIQSGPIVLCQCQDNQNFSETLFDVPDFEHYGLQLWKAKTFGVHTEMYTIDNAVLAMQGGNLYTFEWIRD